jgi:hypothetical protein
MGKEEIRALIERTSMWSPEAQAELVQSIIDIENKYRGVYRLDADERAALERSAEDIRHGRFATEDEVRELFDRIRRA